MTVAPSTVRQGDEITVAVSSGGPMGGWLLRVCESGGRIRSRPTRLAVYGAPAPDGDTVTLECKIRTLGYEPGEYMVDVSPDGEFALGRTVTRRLVVEAAEPKAATRSGAWYLAPIFLGLVGGLIAYVIIRHDDPRKARVCLIIGAAVTVAMSLPMLLSMGVGPLGPGIVAVTVAMSLPLPLPPSAFAHPQPVMVP